VTAYLIILEPSAVKALVRKLEHSVKMIEAEVSNLADQVEEQNL
jgi:hypothetical protein